MLNLDNPKTFDEKLWDLKFNNRNPLLTKCSDKYLVQEYVQECGLEHILNELYGVYDNAKDAKRNIYDMEFKKMQIRVTRENWNDKDFKCPLNFDKMKEYAQILSKSFPFCRVDLYNIRGKIYFGELTFYHAGACNKIEPEEWTTKIGDWIDILSVPLVNTK